MERIYKQDFDCVSEQLVDLCSHLSQMDICNPVSPMCNAIVLAKVEYILKYGEFMDNGFFDQFTEPN